jgi:hypothetical protein
MINLKGGGMFSPVLAASLGVEASYMLSGDGNIWFGIVFLIVSLASTLLLLTMLGRYWINYKRSATFKLKKDS